jgi:hypothetical protein
MSTITIQESGLSFGPFDPTCCFPIESSKTYEAIQNDGVKMAEFLWIKSEGQRRRVSIVEAKSSSPQPGNKQPFDKFIGELRDKLVNGLSLGMAAVLGRHPEAADELPSAFKSLDLGNTEFLLLVVINGHADDWLSPLDDALNAALRSTVKTWALGANSVKVINDRMAKMYGLIVAA